MAKNKFQDGKVIDVPAPAGGVLSGDLVVIGGLVGVALNDKAEGETANVEIEGVWELPKKTTDNVGVGVELFYDATAKNLTVTATSNTYAGIASAAAGSGADTVLLILNYPRR